MIPFRSLAAGLLVSAILSMQAAAQVPKETSPKTQPTETETPQAAQLTAHEMTAADVEAFLAGFVPMQIERENIAGAVVLIMFGLTFLAAAIYVHP